MAEKEVFIIAFIILGISVLIDLYILKLQFKEIRDNNLLLSMKWFLFGSIVFLMTASLSFMLVYADIIWTFTRSVLIVNIAVLGNAVSKVLVGVMLLLIYKFKRD